MSSDPDDPSNNPYNEGGLRSQAPPSTSGTNWFCHQCQRDIPAGELLRTPDPTCPTCRGNFVEETGESVDDPHEFDRPVFPFALFGGPHDDNGQQPGGRQQHQPPSHQGAFHFGGDGQQDFAQGPFGMLFQALTQGLGAPQMQQQQPQPDGIQAIVPHQQSPPGRPLSAQSLSAAEAAAQAAQRRSSLEGTSHDPASAIPGHFAPGGQYHSAPVTQSPSPSASRPSSSGGVYRRGNTTFVWTSSNFNPAGRPPPSSHPANSPQPPESAAQSHGGGGSGPTRPQPVPHQQEDGQGHVRNLASFLQEAFGTPTNSTDNVHRQGDTQRATSAPATGGQSPLQEGPPQHPDNGQQQDPLMSLLGGLVNVFGVPIQDLRPAHTPQGQQGPPGHQQQGQGQGLGTADPEEGGRPPGRTAHFTFGGPGQAGGHMIFTFGGDGGGVAGQGQGGVNEGGMHGFLPFMLMGNGGPPGQMGDYVFSQGALDNIITELMNQAQGRYGPQPAPEELINELPTCKMTQDLLSEDSITECAVCKDDFAVEEDIMKLPCNHIFHVDCIKPWLERSGTCPVCRHQLVPQPEPPRAPGQASQDGQTPGPASPGGPSGASGRTHPSNPASPSLPRSPPIAEGSSMPGSFPFGQIFSSFGSFLSGAAGAGNASGSGGSSSQHQGGSEAHRGGASSHSQQDQAHHSGTGDGGGNRPRDEEDKQGLPDLDLDLD